MCAKDTMNAYHKFIDAVLIGEGEKTIVEIIKGVESNSIHTVNVNGKPSVPPLK